MNKSFLNVKKVFLEKIDKSFKGSIDNKILSLCNLINSRDDMFTTSSCSGRICILEKTNNSKEKNCWLINSHDILDKEIVWKELENYNSDKNLEFRQESTIIHICVENLDLANKLMHLGKTAKFNQVGIISIKKKIVVELICDIFISLPIYDEKLLIEMEYLDYLVDKANSNLEDNWNCIEKLEKEIKKLN